MEGLLRSRRRRPCRDAVRNNPLENRLCPLLKSLDFFARSYTHLLITGASMAFAVHQWRRGYHLIAIGFITFACLIAGVAIEAAKNNQNAEATEVLRQPQASD